MLQTPNPPRNFSGNSWWQHMSRVLVTSVVLLLFVVGCVGGNVSAISDAQRQALDSGVLYFNTEDNSACGSNTTILSGSDNIQQAYNYFVGKGLTDYQAAGIIGNLMQESHVNPADVQANGVGHGIAQWSEPGRWDGVVNLAKSEGVDPTNLGVQLDFMWQELGGTYATALTALQATTNVVDATQSFEQNYEAAGDPVMANRISYAQQALATYGNGSGTGAGSVCGVDCASTSANTAGLSNTRQEVICIAQQELAVWTPPPALPRLEFTKYTQGAIGSAIVPEEWCADFASWVYNQAGDPLQTTPTWRVPGVSSIESIGALNTTFHWHNISEPTKPDYDPTYVPVPGDLAIHGSQHVNIVISVNGNQITMIGGDQGAGPSGGPDSASVVSEYTTPSAAADDPPITGFVSPD